jgi:Protein of unknown function (DUF3108)
MLLFLLTAGNIYGQQVPLRKINNQSFKPGEILEFRIHYGVIDAGEARLEIKEKIHTINDRSSYHVVGTGYTTGAFDWFFKVRDRYESYIDKDAIIPWIFVRRVDEGGYTISQDVTFNHYQKTATSAKLTIPVPENIQDLVSAFYYARTLDYTNAKIGATFPITAYLDDEVFSLTIKYIGKEVVKTKLGTFNCIKFRPMLLQGRVFKEEEDMTVWVTDDDNRIIVRAEASILVGSIKMDLKGYSGLANPLSSKKK